MNGYKAFIRGTIFGLRHCTLPDVRNNSAVCEARRNFAMNKLMLRRDMTNRLINVNGRRFISGNKTRIKSRYWVKGLWFVATSRNFSKNKFNKIS